MTNPKQVSVRRALERLVFDATYYRDSDHGDDWTHLLNLSLEDARQALQGGKETAEGRLEAEDEGGLDDLREVIDRACAAVGKGDSPEGIAAYIWSHVGPRLAASPSPTAWPDGTGPAEKTEAVCHDCGHAEGFHRYGLVDGKIENQTPCQARECDCKGFSPAPTSKEGK